MQLFKHFKPKVKFTHQMVEENPSLLEDYSFKMRKAKLNLIEDGEVLQQGFTDVIVKVSKDASVIVHEDYVYINACFGFVGYLQIEESKEKPESFLKGLIEENEMSKLDSPYPPGFLNDYSVIFKLSDLIWVNINDALIINNTDDPKIREKLINERGEETLENYESWGILPKPSKDD
jgi:hypothetical protein